MANISRNTHEGPGRNALQMIAAATRLTKYIRALASTVRVRNGFGAIDEKKMVRAGPKAIKK